MPDPARSLKNVYESGGQEFESLRVHHVQFYRAEFAGPLAPYPKELTVSWQAIAHCARPATLKLMMWQAGLNLL
jgi:hypothetical protein